MEKENEFVYVWLWPCLSQCGIKKRLESKPRLCAACRTLDGAHHPSFLIGSTEKKKERKMRDQMETAMELGTCQNQF